MKKFLVIIFLGSCITLWGQITPVTSTEKTPFIEVLGKGKIEVEPDMIYLFIRLSKTTVNREEITVEMQESRLRSALERLNIPPGNLTLKDTRGYISKKRWKGADLQTDRSYSLLLSNAKALNQVMEALDELNVVSAYIEKLDHSRMDSLEQETRMMATRYSKEEAARLLGSIGAKQGKLLYLKTLDGYTDLLPGTLSGVNIKGSRSNPQAYYIDGVRIGNGEDGVPFQKIEIRSVVLAHYAIE